MIDSFRGPYRFLSNFQSCIVYYEGLRYPTTEHAYQAAKSLDPKERAMVAALPTAAEAKKAGKLVTRRPGFEDMKLKVMSELLLQKFSDLNPAMRDALIATGDEYLVEGNDWGDTYWGVCKGVGDNHLGRLLMEVRGLAAALAATPR